MTILVMLKGEMRQA